jgi:hypothetical protein
MRQMLNWIADLMRGMLAWEVMENGEMVWVTSLQPDVRAGRSPARSGASVHP